jgi:hypothetical protein
MMMTSMTATMSRRRRSASWKTSGQGFDQHSVVLRQGFDQHSVVLRQGFDQHSPKHRKQQSRQAVCVVCVLEHLQTQQAVWCACLERSVLSATAPCCQWELCELCQARSRMCDVWLWVSLPGSVLPRLIPQHGCPCGLTPALFYHAWNSTLQISDAPPRGCGLLLSLGPTTHASVCCDTVLGATEEPLQCV